MSPAGEETYLVVEGGARRFPLTNGQSWAIGRGDGCAVLLDSRSVSRLHALIQRREAGDFSLVDLGSRNGSFVNGTRVSVPRLLNDNDRLLFGDQQLVFHTSAPTSTGAAPPDASARNLRTTAIHTHTLATIVVVDIRDFTPLARTLSESLLSQTIGTWFLRVGQIAERLGSWAQKYIGDAVMAVWVHDDPARLPADLLRALEAVSQIDAATAEMDSILPLPGPLRIGAGINTGLAIVGGADYTALGDTVNAAFRLESATKSLGTEVLLGERAFVALNAAPGAPFLCREVELKGYDSPSRVWAASFADLRCFLRAAQGKPGA